jgi:hypothetical protein
VLWTEIIAPEDKSVRLLIEHLRFTELFWEDGKTMNTDSEHDPEAVRDVLAADEFPLGDATPELAVEAHDVLAADEFPLGDADPVLHSEPIHDVLAADEFPLGDADPVLEREEFEHELHRDEHGHHGDHHHHDHHHHHDGDDVIYIDLPVVAGVLVGVAGVVFGVWQMRKRQAIEQSWTRAKADAALAAAQQVPERARETADHMSEAAGRVADDLRKRLKRA